MESIPVKYPNKKLNKNSNFSNKIDNTPNLKSNKKKKLLQPTDKQKGISN